MTRVKRGVTALKRRRNILKQVKGFRFGRSTKEIQAKDALLHAGNHAFAHRKDKKGDRRNLWQVKIGAALKGFELSYSKFIAALKKHNIAIDRKILADLAEYNKDTFAKIVAKVK